MISIFKRRPDVSRLHYELLTIYDKINNLEAKDFKDECQKKYDNINCLFSLNTYGRREWGIGVRRTTAFFLVKEIESLKEKIALELWD